MSKYIVLSFDDGRLDTYTRAVPIMNKYGIKGTINITTDFINNENKYLTFASSGNKAMNVDMIREIKKNGFEIAGHSHTHSNDIEDIRAGLKILADWKVKDGEIGFASPYSYICDNNFKSIKELIENGEICYVRSGIQVRREGMLYSLLYVIQEIFNSKHLFYLLNRKQILKLREEHKFYVGISVTSKTTLEEISFLIDKMPENSAAIFILHSILDSSDEGYGKDKWYIDVNKFEELCTYLASNKRIKVVTNKFLRDEIECMK